jgi:hypothetical protein
MTKTGKTLLGAATLWPLLYMILFFLVVVGTMLFSVGGGRDPIQGIFPIFILVHLLTMLITLALSIFYIVNVFRNDRIQNDKKALWAIVIFMGNAIAMPIYWYLYFWKAEPAPSMFAPGQLNGVNTASWASEAGARNPQQEYVPPAQPPNWRD